MQKHKRAVWAVTAEWIEESIRGVVETGQIKKHEFNTVARWDEKKAKASWQKNNRAYKVLSIEFKGITTQTYS